MIGSTIVTIESNYHGLASRFCYSQGVIIGSTGLSNDNLINAYKIFSANLIASKRN